MNNLEPIMPTMTLDHAIQFIDKHMYHKDKNTFSHCRKVALLLGIFLDYLDIPVKEAALIRETGKIHDVGKILIPSHILTKPSCLTIDEFENMKQHTILGYEYLRACAPFQDHAILTLYHHERWDGQGYPTGLKKENIPLGARIIAIVDAFEAMTGKRVYRKSIPHEMAIREIQANAGTQFDPKLASVFAEAMTTILMTKKDVAQC